MGIGLGSHVRTNIGRHLVEHLEAHPYLVGTHHDLVDTHSNSVDTLHNKVDIRKFSAWNYNKVDKNGK